MLEGLGQLQQGFATWQQGYNGLKSFQQAAAAQGTTLPDPSAATYEIVSLKQNALTLRHIKNRTTYRLKRVEEETI